MNFIGNEHSNLVDLIECCTDEENNVYSVMPCYSQGDLLHDPDHGLRRMDDAMQPLLLWYFKSLLFWIIYKINLTFYLFYDS